eukprot:510138_1
MQQLLFILVTVFAGMSQSQSNSDGSHYRNTSYWTNTGLMTQTQANDVLFDLPAGKTAKVMKYWTKVRNDQCHDNPQKNNWASRAFSKYGTTTSSLHDTALIDTPAQLGISKTKAGVLWSDALNILESQLSPQDLKTKIEELPHYLRPNAVQKQPKQPKQKPLQTQPPNPLKLLHENEINDLNKKLKQLESTDFGVLDLTNSADKDRDSDNDNKMLQVALAKSLKEQSTPTISPQQKQLHDFKATGWNLSDQSDKRILVVRAIRNAGITRITSSILLDVCKELGMTYRTAGGVQSFNAAGFKGLIAYNSAKGIHITDKFAPQVDDILAQIALFPPTFATSIMQFASVLMKGPNGVDPRVTSHPMARQPSRRNKQDKNDTKLKNKKKHKNKRKKKYKYKINSYNRDIMKDFEGEFGPMVLDDIMASLDKLLDIKKRDAMRIIRDLRNDIDKESNRQRRDYSRDYSPSYNSYSRSRSRSGERAFYRDRDNRYSDKTRSPTQSREHLDLLNDDKSAESMEILVKDKQRMSISSNDKNISNEVLDCDDKQDEECDNEMVNE